MSTTNRGGRQVETLSDWSYLLHMLCLQGVHCTDAGSRFILLPKVHQDDEFQIDKGFITANWEKMTLSYPFINVVSGLHSYTFYIRVIEIKGFFGIIDSIQLFDRTPYLKSSCAISQIITHIRLW